MNDQQIIAAITRNENKHVFKELYKTVFPLILKHVKNNSGSRFDSEDCFQECLLELFAAIKKGKFDNKYAIKNYMVGVARNKWLHELRRRKRFSDSGTITSIVDDTTSVFDREDETIIKNLFESLGERCEQLLNLIIYDNMKHKEVMSVMGMASESVVKTTYFRCKDKLRSKVKNSTAFYRLLKGE